MLSEANKRKDNLDDLKKIKSDLSAAIATARNRIEEVSDGSMHITSIDVEIAVHRSTDALANPTCNTVDGTVLVGVQIRFEDDEGCVVLL